MLATAEQVGLTECYQTLFPRPNIKRKKSGLACETSKHVCDGYLKHRVQSKRGRMNLYIFALRKTWLPLLLIRSYSNSLFALQLKGVAILSCTS